MERGGEVRRGRGRYFEEDWREEEGEWEGEGKGRERRREREEGMEGRSVG